ncbi:ABC transporter ATP-binding protein [Gulosibacter sp. 10]|uniref:ABC transporter ATP-binding protein n=1 Tax=Gulosibacter sp. 10 TaxID=1255570 RepID=UPI0020CE6141|nr:ABC transporter ATP-binding protein [Gulosibacter sp. 10]
MHRASTHLRARGLTWTPWGAEPTLVGIDLEVGVGERVLITGASGSGKSTLLRALAGVLVDYAPGDLTGEVSSGAGEGVVCLLLQNPTDQVVAGTVGRDVAFGPENLGITGDSLHAIVRRSLGSVGLRHLAPDRRSTHLSGGQGQRLALAGLLAMQPSALLLDEPLAMLDHESAAEARTAIVRVAEHSGSALVIADHDLAGWWPHIDRVIVLEHGRIVFDGSPEDASAHLHSPELWLPGASPPAEPIEIAWQPDPAAEAPDAEPRLSGYGLGYSTSSGTRLASADIELKPGDGVAVTGPSGAGKTTLLRLLAGWYRPSRGVLMASTSLRGAHPQEPYRWASKDLAARIAFMGQNPDRGIVAKTVLEEVLLTRRLTGRFTRKDIPRAGRLLECLALDHAEARNPHTLSGGEQRRLAIAAAVASDAPVVLLDEPTVGQDRSTWRGIRAAIELLRQHGRSLAVSTHDARLSPFLNIHAEIRPVSGEHRS